MATKKKPQAAMTVASDVLCPLHQKPGTIIFHCCAGTKGGSSRSPAKMRAVKRNLAAFNARRKKAVAERKRAERAAAAL